MNVRRLNGKERERLDRLRRRCDFLRQRIAVHGLQHSHDRAELSALNIARFETAREQKVRAK